MNEKRKIIIICNDFPPHKSVGAQRPAAWCKYFDFQEYEIHVFCRKWLENFRSPSDYFRNNPCLPDISFFENATIHYCDFIPNWRDRLILINKNNQIIKIIQKFLTLVYFVFPFFFSNLDSTRKIYHTARKFILMSNNIFFIIATGEPFITFLYAKKLSKEFNIRWCADYRDGWSLNYGVQFMPFLQRILLRTFIRRIETNLVQTARVVVTVNDLLAQKLEKLHKRKVYVVQNGFWEEDFIDIDSEGNEKYLFNSNKFIISYSGSLYPYQPIEDFFSFFLFFLERYNLNSQEFEFHFWGTKGVLERLKDFKDNKTPKIICHPKLPRKELIINLSRSHLLLFLSSDKIDGSAVKIYDYFALRRPIFVFKNDHASIEKLINQTRIGFLHNNSELSGLYLKNLYKSYKLHEKGSFVTNPSNLHIYSRKHQTDILQKILEENVGG